MPRVPVAQPFLAVLRLATRLRDRGVPTEKVPFAQNQTLGIWTTPDGSRVAWFKDPGGNILSISQHVS